MWNGLGKVMRDYTSWQSHRRKRALEMDLSKVRHFRGMWTATVCVCVCVWLTATLSYLSVVNLNSKENLSLTVLLLPLPIEQLWAPNWTLTYWQWNCKVHISSAKKMQKKPPCTGSQMRLSMASTMTQVVSTCDEGLVREIRRKVEEGGAIADWGWREGGESDSAALPKGLEEKSDEEAPKWRGVQAGDSHLRF